MNEPSQNGHANPPENKGIGDSLTVDRRTGGQDIRLYRRAIQEGWNVPGASKKVIVDELTRIVLQIERDGSKRDVDPRNIIQASKALIAADSNDVRIQLGAEDKGVHVNVGVQTNVVMPTRDLLNEPGYLDYLRNRASAADSDAGPVCESGEPGAVEGGASPNGDRPPLDNGHI